MVHSGPQERPSIPTGEGALNVAILLEGLRAIARDQRFRHGPGDIFTVLPTHTGFEAMERARGVLLRAGAAKSW